MNYFRVSGTEKMSNDLPSQLLRNDLILYINNMTASSVEELKSIREKSSYDTVLTIIRNGNLLEIKQEKGCTLGAGLVPIIDDNSIEELLDISRKNEIDNNNAILAQIEIDQADKEFPKRIIHVLIIYPLLFIISYILMPFIGINYGTLILFLMPIVYLISGKRLFKR